MEPESDDGGGATTTPSCGELSPVSAARRSGERAMGFAVFLVDDDAGVLDALSRLLRAAGYEPHAYSSARQFLAEYDPSIPGCVILDLAMPMMGGLELQRRLKDRDPDRPVVFLTGTGDETGAALARKAGAIDFLEKPVDEAALLAALDCARRRYEGHTRRA